MDFVIRRQSEKIDSNYNEDLNNSAEDDYDYRKWEWGYLRVRIALVFEIKPFAISAVLYSRKTRRQNAKIYFWNRFTTRTFSGYKEAICRYFW